MSDTRLVRFLVDHTVRGRDLAVLVAYAAGATEVVASDVAGRWVRLGVAEYPPAAKPARKRSRRSPAQPKA